MKRLAFIVVLAALLLAGCIGEEPPETVPMTGTDAAALAEEAGLSWADDAELVILTGFEVPAGHEVIDRQEELDAYFVPAEEIGDGVTPVWMATFYSEELNETHFFQVLPETTIVLPQIEQPIFDESVALEWSVDSPEAVQEALKDEAFNETIEQGALAAITYRLNVVDSEPTWRLSATPEPRGDPVEVFVHALDGTFLG